MTKILIYVEPHPIRNKMTNYRNVISYFKNVVHCDKSEYDIKFFSNKETLDEGSKLIDDFGDYCIYPQSDEENFFHRQLIEWDSNGIMKWVSMMEENSFLYSYYKDLIIRLHDLFAFDCIVCWGTNSAVRSAAKILGCGFVDLELGCSRKPYLDTIVIDPCGVNGEASTVELDVDTLRQLNIRSSHGQDDILKYGFKNSSLAYEEIFKYVADKKIRTLIQSDENICFIPLQLYDDANLLRYSHYNSVLDVMMDVLPKLQKAGYRCLIKEHPGSALRSGAQKANEEAKNYALGFENVIWLDDEQKQISNALYFSIASLIITVNSSVGFESLFYEKPLIILGEAVYKIKGVFPQLDEYLSGCFNPQEYIKNISLIRNFFYEYYLVDSDIFQNPNSLISKIVQIGELSKKNCSFDEIANWYIDNEFAK